MVSLWSTERPTLLGYPGRTMRFTAHVTVQVSSDSWSAASRRTVSWLVGAVALAGCSVLIDPDESQLGGDETVVDSGIRLLDSGGNVDAARPDSTVVLPPPDSGPAPGCAPEGASRCEGEDLVFCTGGVEARESCAQANAFCDDGAQAGCVPWRCTPGSTMCVEGTSQVCDARGRESSRTPCPQGCDDATGQCHGGQMSCEDVHTIERGATVVANLCERQDRHTFTEMNDCRGAEARSGDAVFRFTLQRQRTVRIRVRDEDPVASIDTVVYVRSQCDAPNSQIACHDDTSCERASLQCFDSDFSAGQGQQVRESLIETTLNAGTYYIVVDAYLYVRPADNRNFTCGLVSVRLDTSG